MIEFSGSFRNIMICNIIILYRDTQKRNLRYKFIAVPINDNSFLENYFDDMENEYRLF